MGTSKITFENASAKNIFDSLTHKLVGGGSGTISELTGLHLNMLAKKNDVVHVSVMMIKNKLMNANF
jgi:hypothetical protein